MTDRDRGEMANRPAEEERSHTWTNNAMAYNWSTFFQKIKNFKYRNDESVSHLGYITPFEWTSDGQKSSPQVSMPRTYKLDEKQPITWKRVCPTLVAFFVGVILTSAVFLPLLLIKKNEPSDTSKSYSEYELTIRVENKNFSEEMRNNESTQFKMTASSFCNGIDQLFNSSSYQASYEGCVVTELRNGSIIVDFVLVIESSQNTSPTEADLLLTLSQGLPDDDFVTVNDLQYKPSSISFGRSLTSTTSRLSTVTCGQDPVIENGEVISTGFSYGDTVTFSCKEGYTMTGNNKLACNTPFYWGVLPTCDINHCSLLEFPDHMIYLNESEYTKTFGSNVTLRCKEGYSIQGDPFVYCQANGSWTVLPECRLLSCSELVIPNNSQSNVSTQSNFTDGQIVKVVCNEGYELVMYKTCSLENGWVDSFTCEPIICDEFVPSNESHIAYTTGTDLLYGSTISIRCEEGYSIDGSIDAQIICLSNKMWSSNPKCRPVDCGPVVFPENAIRDRINGTTVNNTKEISCMEGYITDAVNEITCLANGSWSSIPNCKKVDCGNVPDLLNGEIVVFTGNKYLDYIIFKCAQGYAMEGNISINCQANGNWSDGPTCEKVTCPEIFVANGSLNGTMRDFGDILKVRCDNGFRIVGNETISCQSNKVWSEVPRCERIICNDNITTPEHSYLPCRESLAAFGDFLEIQCSVGYEMMSGVGNILCLEDGSWGEIPVCSPVLCATFNYPNNSISPNEGNETFVYNETITIECMNNFKRVGPESVICRADGTWSTSPTCEPIVCPQINPPTNGIFQPSLPEYALVGQTIVVSCEEGYVLTFDGNITCLENGTWSPIGDCMLIKCSELQLPNNSITISGSLNQSKYNSEVKIACNPGYKIQGNDTVRCLSDTTWSSLPNCTRKECQAYNLTENVYIVQDNSGFPPKFEDNLLLNCTVGYVLKGNANTFCLENETWSSFPICEKVKCPQNATFDYGYITLLRDDGREYGDFAQASCYEGYERSGNNTVECLSNGQWDGEGACEIIDCGEFNQTIPNIMIKNQTGTTYESSIYFACNDSYILVGKNPIHCQSNKSWHDGPSCVLSSCGLVENVENGFIRSINDSYFEVACEFGYLVNGTSVFSCKTGGVQPESPFCHPVDCGPVKSIPNGNIVSSTGTTFSQITKYECKEGYKMHGGQNVSCLGSGEWGDLPRCDIIDCGMPAQLLYGLYFGENLVTTLNSTLTVECIPGYTYLEDISTTTCLLTGQWSSLIQCIPVECPVLFIANGEVVSYTNSNMFGSIATIICNDGYAQESCIGTSRCNETGMWDIAEDCVPIDCGTPVQPLNGQLDIYSSTTFETKIYISCDAGFKNVGDNFTSCGTNGIWSLDNTCEKIDCGHLNASFEGQFIETTTTFKSLAVVECNNGNSIPVFCGETGKWLMHGSNTIFTGGNCNQSEEANCGLPIPIENANFIYVSGIKAYDYATVECETGYIINGNASIVCESNGSWSAYPECVIVDCGIPYPPANARNFTNGSTTYGSEFEFQCIDGYTKQVNDSMTCDYDGYWTLVPGCVIDCGPYDMIEHGLIQFQNGTGLKSIVRVRCEDGFYLYDLTVDFVRCTQYGRWEGDPYCINQVPGQAYMRCLEKNISEVSGTNVTTECLLRDVNAINNMHLYLNENEIFEEITQIQSDSEIAVGNGISIRIGMNSEKMVLTFPISCQNEGTFRLRINSNVEDTIDVRVIANPMIQQFEKPENVYLRQQTTFGCSADLGRDSFGKGLANLIFERMQDDRVAEAFKDEEIVVTKEEGTCLNLVTFTLTLYPDITFNNTKLRCSLINATKSNETLFSSEAYEMKVLNSNVYFIEMDTKKFVQIGDHLSLYCIVENVVNFVQMSIDKDQDTLVTLYKNGTTVPDLNTAGSYTSPSGFLEFNITSAVCSSKGAYICSVYIAEDSSISTVLNVQMTRLPDYPDFYVTVDVIENKIPWGSYPTKCFGSLGYPMGTMQLKTNLRGNFTTLDNATISYTNNDDECTSSGDLTYYNFDRFNMSWHGTQMRCVVKNDRIFVHEYELSVSRIVQIIPVSTCDGKAFESPFEHPYACNSAVTCVDNANVLVPNTYCDREECYNWNQARCDPCEWSNKCNIPTTSLPVTPAPTLSPIFSRLYCPYQVAATKDNTVNISCVLTNDQVSLDDLTTWYITISHSNNKLFDTRNDSPTTDNGDTKMYTVTEDFLVEVSATTIQFTLTLDTCNKTGFYKTEYVKNLTLQSETEILITAPAEEPVLSKTPTQFYRNQMSSITCSGNIGNPTSQMSLVFNSDERENNDESHAIRHLDEATCGYIETKTYRFYVREYMENHTVACETLLTNGSTIASTQEALVISEPVILFDDIVSTSFIGSPYGMNCRWDSSIAFDKVIIRRRSLSSDIFVNVLIYDTTQVVTNISGIFGSVTNVPMPAIFIQFATTRCEDEGEYTCELQLNADQIGIVQVFLYVTDTNSEATLTLPIQLVVNTPTLQKQDFLQCLADVGYRNAYDLRFEYLDTTTNAYEVFTLGSELSLENQTSNCQTILTRRREAITFDESWDGVTMRCAVYDTTTGNVVATSHTKAIRLLNDHCDGTNDETYRCHPYNCRLYTRCHSSGYMSVLSCREDQCVVIRTRPTHYAECRHETDCEDVIGVPCPC